MEIEDFVSGLKGITTTVTREAGGLHFLTVVIIKMNEIHAFWIDQQSKCKLNVNWLLCVIRRLRLFMPAVMLA